MLPEIGDLRVERLAARAETTSLTRELTLLKAQPCLGLAHTDSLLRQFLRLRLKRGGLLLEDIGLLLELRLLRLQRIRLRGQRLLLLLETGLHRLRLVVLRRVLGAGFRHRIERDRHHQRTVVARAEAVGDHVEGLALGRLERRRTDVLLAEHQREDRDDHQRQQRQRDHARTNRMVDHRVGPVAPDAELGRVLLGAADKRQLPAVDGIAEHGEDRRQEREPGEHSREDADRTGVAECGDEGDLRDRERQQRDDDGAPGEQHGPTTRSEHLGNRLTGVQPVLAHQRAVFRDEEERVVDADAEPDHRGERRPDRRDAREVAHQANQGGPDQQTEDGREDWQAHRDERREREEQDDHRGNETDHLTRFGALCAQRRSDGTTDIDLHAGGATLLNADVIDALRRGGAKRAATDVEQDRNEGVVAVLADEPGGGVRERVRHGVDVLDLLQRVVRVGDGLLVLATVLDLPRGVEDDGAAAVLLRREVLRQQVGRRLAAGAGQRKVVVRERSDLADHQRPTDDRGNPEDDHEPAIADAEVPEGVKHAT